MKYAIIVDAVVSGNALAYECILRGIKCIHLYSSLESYKLNFNSLSTVFFEKGLIYTTDNDLKEYLKTIDATIVLCTPGSDYGVSLANHLCKLFDLEVNDVVFDRYIIQKTINENCSDVNFQEFVNKYGKSVVKPRISYGGYDRVKVINSGETVEDNDLYYITPFYEGDEYAVDFVSFKGKHKIVSVWRYVKDKVNPFWREKTELLHYDQNSDLINLIYEYIVILLTSINYKTGASHSEVIVNDNNIKLVEVNFRTHGHLDYASTSKALSRNHPQLTIDSLTGKAELFQNLTPAYITNSNITRLNLFNKVERTFNSIKWEDIRKLPSHSATYLHYTPYQIIPISEYNIRSIPAEVLFINTDLDQLKKDIDAAKEMFNE